VHQCPPFARRTIDVPSIFIPGKSDWGVYQRPGAVDRMLDTARTRFVGLSQAAESGGKPRGVRSSVVRDRRPLVTPPRTLNLRK